MTLPRLTNRAARRLFLDRHALVEPRNGPTTGADLLALIRRHGFVQVDSINRVQRAHHMILWSRRQSYRPDVLRWMLDRDRTLFEHWTHDAAIIPMEFLPHWRLRFARDALSLRSRYRGWQGPEFEEKLDYVMRYIIEHGPAGTRDVGKGEVRGKGGWWEWHPSKTALEFLWRSGRTAITRRDGFAKIYDLAERVYPDCEDHSEETTITWACNGALDRLGFATSGEIAEFWGLVRPEEARVWTLGALKRGEIEEVEVENADGTFRRHFARPGLLLTAAETPEPSTKVRVLSPFDPALRNRGRTLRLFGFDYRIEVFVPQAKRQYGYYVFPVLQDDRVIGRLDARVNRAEGVLKVAAFWPERSVKMTKSRFARLEAELARLAQFAGSERVVFEPDWLR